MQKYFYNKLPLSSRAWFDLRVEYEICWRKMHHILYLHAVDNLPRVKVKAKIFLSLVRCAYCSRYKRNGKLETLAYISSFTSNQGYHSLCCGLHMTYSSQIRTNTNAIYLKSLYLHFLFFLLHKSKS